MRDDIAVAFSCGVEYKGCLYIASVRGNELFKYDIETKKIVFLLNFEKEQDREYLYRSVILYKNEAWFVPQAADNIAIVNLDTLNVRYIPLQYKWIRTEFKLKCAGAKIFEDHFLCIVPFDIDALMVINMETLETKCYYATSNEAEQYVDVVYDSGCLYCIPWTAEKILQINLETGERKKLEWDYKRMEYSGAVTDERKKKIWLIPAQASHLVAYDLEKKSIEKVQIDDEMNNGGQYIRYWYSGIYLNKLFIFPYKKKYVIACDIENEEIQRYDLDVLKVDPPFFKPFGGNSLWGTMEYTDQLYWYDFRKDCFKICSLQVDYDEIYYDKTQRRLKERLKENSVTEDKWQQLQNFLEII